MQHDPLLSAYREAAEIYLRASDMPQDIQASFVERVCAGRDLVLSSVRALLAVGPAAPAGIAPAAVNVAERLHRFLDATAGGSRSDVTRYVPSPDEPDRERTLAELIKLDQKLRWASGETKALEAYLHEWPELRTAPALITELLGSECLARAVFASPATETELRLRFPALASAMRLDEISARAEVVQRALSLGVSAPLMPSRFSIVRKIGQGGMGIVYEAIDKQQGTTVALKTLPRMEPRALLRFKREFRTLAGLAHRNLVSLYELVSDGSEWLFTMELIRGADFVTYLRRCGPSITGGVLRAALEQLAEGVMALHAADIVHCDLKPSNVLVQDDGRVVILDFGVAKELSAIRVGTETPRPLPAHAPTMASPMAAGATWTEDQYVFGSVWYMSPEQAAGEHVTCASDWYSVGVMLYESLTGKVPFAGDPDMLIAKQCDDPVRPSRFVRGLADDLDDLCMALLNRTPDARPGGPEILKTLRVPGGSAPRRVPVRRALPFVGRSAELRALAAAYEALVHQKRAITVHVRGRSGAGKTALAQRFLAGLPAGALVLAGRCYEQESVPYKALDSLVDQLCRHLMHLPRADADALLSPDIPALARIFPVLERLEAVRLACRTWAEIPDARELRRRAFGALAEMLQRLGTTAPLVLFIDDLQWGDVDSAALLITLLDAPQPPPLLFLACYRSEHASTNSCLVALDAARDRQTSFDVDVKPLTPEDSLELASLLLSDSTAQPTAAATVARESGGNPYFVYELARQVESRRGSALDGGDIVLDLDEALWRRVLTLEPPAQHLLEVVAAAGKPLPLRSAAAAAGIGAELPAAVAILRAERLVRSTGPGPDNEIETYHDRIRESVTSHLTAVARADHHRRLALALEAVGHTDIEETASHFHRAGVRDKAARHYAMAADKAAAALAFGRAAELYGLSIELGDATAAETRALRRKCADALANAGRGYEAGREYQRAAEGAGIRDVVDLQCNAGYQFCVSGHIDQGRDAFGVVLANFGRRLPRTRRQALLSLLWRRFRLRLRGTSFRERAEREVPHKELERVDVFWSLAAGMTIADPIRGADFQTLDLILALRAGEPYRIARALAWDAAHLAMAGVRLKARAEAQLAQAEALAQRIDRPHATGTILMSRGVAAYFQGDFAACERHTKEAVRIFRERCTGVAWELETCNAFAFWPLYFKGEFGELTQRFGSLIAEVRERGARLAEADLTTFGGPFVWLAADDPDGAERAVRGAMGEWSHQDFQVQHFTTLTAEAQIALYRGDAEGAWRRVLDQWAGLRDAMLLHVEIVRIYMLHLRARCALAAAADIPDRAPLLRAAAADARRLERERPSYAPALAKTIRAALLAQHGNTGAAAALLMTAAEELTALGWGCFGIGARRQYGLLIGGEEGARVVREVDAALAAQQVARPDLLCGVQAPGFEAR